MRLLSVLRSFPGKHVLVVGDIILDRFLWGRVDRISPEAPVPVVDVQRESIMPGGAANVACNIAALGGKATVLGVLGEDRAADQIQELMREHRIECLDVRDDRPTTQKTRVIAQHQQVVRFDHEDKSPIGGRALRTLLEIIREQAKQYDAIVISDYRKGVVSRKLVEALLEARGKDVTVAVDPKVGNFSMYKKSTLITPNLKEASEGTGIDIVDEDSLKEAGRALMEKLSLPYVLITRGEHGMSLFEKKKVTHIPTLAKKVFDVTGAGDTVIAALSLASAAGATMGESAVIANHAAGIVVAEVGTAVATTDAVRESIKQSDISISEERLK
jgi:D-beta-D-heptose 7-phosphate kinase/D-beta-D-heptose 1-phosphate adenosyltransferase